jgi:hypothetical protein
MDERTARLARTLKDRIDLETGLFNGLGLELDRLRDSFQDKAWNDSLAIACGLERSTRMIEEADAARDEAFMLLKEAMDMPQESAFTAILPELPEDRRRELEESWRAMRVAIVRLKTSAGRMRYAAEAMADTFNRILEQVFPYRRGKLYSRTGAPTRALATHIVDHRL